MLQRMLIRMARNAITAALMDDGFKKRFVQFAAARIRLPNLTDEEEKKLIENVYLVMLTALERYL